MTQRVNIVADGSGWRANVSGFEDQLFESQAELLAAVQTVYPEITAGDLYVASDGSTVDLGTTWGSQQLVLRGTAAGAAFSLRGGGGGGVSEVAEVEEAVDDDDGDDDDARTGQALAALLGVFRSFIPPHGSPPRQLTATQVLDGLGITDRAARQTISNVFLGAVMDADGNFSIDLEDGVSFAIGASVSGTTREGEAAPAETTIHLDDLAGRLVVRTVNGVEQVRLDFTERGWRVDSITMQWIERTGNQVTARGYFGFPLLGKAVRFPPLRAG